MGRAARKDTPNFLSQWAHARRRDRIDLILKEREEGD
jgi:hypothetical protein